MDKQRIIDLNSRELIIHNTNSNYFVEAGAGSGKTTVLVERMVAMIEEGKKIEHICAITFTKAAANEFYARFQKRLIERSNEETKKDFVYSPTKLNNPTDETRRRCKDALQNIDLAFMGTIDAFCNMIISEHPSICKIPPNSVLISDEESDALYLKEYTNILNGFYNDEVLKDKARLFKSYMPKDNEAFISALKFLLDHRNCEIVVPNIVVENLDAKFNDEKKAIIRIFEKLIEHPEFVTSNNEDNAKELVENLSRYLQTIKQSWNDNVTSISYALKYTLLNKNFRLYPDENIKTTLGSLSRYFVDHEVRGKVKWLETSEELKNILEVIEAYKYQITLEFVLSARDLILNKLRREGKLTFSDYLIYLRDALKDDASKNGLLIKHVSERHKYFMIDEFQDTDPIQSEIFFYLSAKNINPDWKKCVPNDGSLFIVGDPKQSIYRFKNADVASFLNVKKMFVKMENGEVLNLFCNFRSTYQVRDWFNKTFIDLLKESTDQSPYPLIPIDEEEKNDDFSGIFSYEAPKKDEGILESDKVASIILKLVDNPKYQITAKEFIEGREVKIKRNLKWKDFMLITPGKTKLAEYTSSFRNYAIPYFVEGNIKFEECPSLVELCKIYSAVALNNDNRYLYNALKSKLFNVEENELIDLRNNHQYLDLNVELDKVNSTNLKNALSTLKDLYLASLSLNPSTIFKKMIEELHILEIVGSKNLEYLYFTLEQIKDKENSKEIVSHKDLVNYLDSLLENDLKLERCPGLIKDGNQVHLANLHKVKGLEAPIVILASPSKKGSPVEFRKQDNAGYVFKISKRNGTQAALIETKNYEELKQLETNSVEAENIRLAYVAATRARNVLIIASNTLTKGGQSSSNPWKYLLNDYVNDLSIALKEDEVKLIQKDFIDASSFKHSTFAFDEINLKPSYINVSPSKQVENIFVSKYSEDLNDDKLLKIQDDGLNENATLIGTLVHRLMELIVISKNKISRENLIKQITYEYKNLLNDELLQKSSLYLNNVYDTITSGGFHQIYGCDDDILKILMEADEVKCEVPFSYKENDKLITGVVDLIYKKDNEYHIVDYKTNKDGLDLSAHYRAQLEGYKKAIERCLSIKVKDALIYHINIKDI